MGRGLSIFNELKRRNVLRVGAAYLAAAWLLIQIADTLFPLFDLPESARRVLVIVLAIGLVPALLGAWLFELTPAGVKRESGEAHTSPESIRATRRFDRAIIAVLALAVVVFSVDRFVLDPVRDSQRIAEPFEQSGEPSAGPPAGSIAVLAFADLSPGRDQAYFSEGIAVELMDLLTKVPGLRVTARDSAFSFKGTGATYAEIAARLDVAHLLEGTVRTAGEQVRVTASLIDPGTGEQVWSYSPDPRPIEDVFAIQMEIAAEVVEQLPSVLTRSVPEIDQTTPEVHSLYLQARHIIDTAEEDRLELARDLLLEAVEKDPAFFPARSFLAGAYLYLGVTRQLDRQEADRLVVATMEEAASIWPDRPEIIAWRGARAASSGDLATAARYFERAFAQDPSLTLSATTPQFLVELNRLDEAVEVGEEILLRDPVCIPCRQFLIYSYFYAGRFDAALAVHGRGTAIGLELPADSWYALALLMTGNAEAALAEFERDGMAPGPGVAMALHALGRTDEAEAAVADLTESRGPNFFGLATYYAYIGDADKAFEILNVQPRLIPRMFSDPVFASLREHPRYEELLRKAGIYPEDPRDAIEFDFELPD